MQSAESIFLCLKSNLLQGARRAAPDALALAHAAISWQPTVTTAGLSPTEWHPTNMTKDSKELIRQLCPPSPQLCAVLFGTPGAVLPFPPCHLPMELVPPVSGGLQGGKGVRENPPGHPTIVIPRLQISDLTL